MLIIIKNVFIYIIFTIRLEWCRLNQVNKEKR
jgi:hypothetical protein